MFIAVATELGAHRGCEKDWLDEAHVCTTLENMIVMEPLLSPTLALPSLHHPSIMNGTGGKSHSREV